MKAVLSSIGEVFMSALTVIMGSLMVGSVLHRRSGHGEFLKAGLILAAIVLAIGIPIAIAASIAEQKRLRDGKRLKGTLPQ